MTDVFTAELGRLKTKEKGASAGIAAIEGRKLDLTDPVNSPALLQLVDWLFIDLKHMDPAKHLELTGRNNEFILRNVNQASSILLERSKSLVVRQVVIPTINDNQNIYALADFIATLPFTSGVELLDYHNYGVYKYGLLGRKYNLTEVRSPTAEEMQTYRRVLKEKKLNVIKS